MTIKLNEVAIRYIKNVEFGYKPIKDIEHCPLQCSTCKHAYFHDLEEVMHGMGFPKDSETCKKYNEAKKEIPSCFCSNPKHRVSKNENEYILDYLLRIR